MALKIVSADERLSQANARTSAAIFGPSGVGKTSLLKTLPAFETLCIDLEAGLKSVQDWQGDSLPVRTFADALDLACLIGGIDPAADAQGFFSEGHYQHLSETYPNLVRLIAAKRIVFVDSITDLTRQAMAWAKSRPEAVSEKTGKPDTRGAYGLLARETIGLLKHLQHAPGKTVIFVGILERVTDEFNRTIWQPQMEGGKAARELPGIVDQVISMGLFMPDADGFRHDPERGGVRRLVCKAGNPFGLPAKDRSGRLDLTEPPDLGALLSKINNRSLQPQKRILRGLCDLSGIAFVAKIRIEASSNPGYGDSNRLDRVVLPNEPEWKKVMAGEAVAPAPSTQRRKAGPSGTVASVPARAPAKPPVPAWAQPQANWAASPSPATAKPASGPAWLNT